MSVVHFLPPSSKSTLPRLLCDSGAECALYFPSPAGPVPGFVCRRTLKQGLLSDALVSLDSRIACGSLPSERPASSSICPRMASLGTVLPVPSKMSAYQGAPTSPWGTSLLSASPSITPPRWVCSKVPAAATSLWMASPKSEGVKRWGPWEVLRSRR